MTRVLDVPSHSTRDAHASCEPHRPRRTPPRERSADTQPWERRPGEPYPPELWLRTHEPYDAAVVLEDLARTSADTAAAQRILARFAALRLVLNVVDGALPKGAIAEERAIAETYVDVLPDTDAERHALAHMMAAAAYDLRRDVAIHAIESGDHAAHHGHDAGAYWLFRTAYTLSHASQWRPESLRAATAIAAAARAGRAPKAARTWRRRARAIERAIARAQQNAAQTTELRPGTAGANGREPK